jgi:hypothetical protein
MGRRKLNIDEILTDEILLDYDNDHPGKILDIERIGYIARKLRLKFTEIKAYKTSNGVHIHMKLKNKIHPVTAVLIQALMGSDYARETHNAIRVYNMLAHPEKYKPEMWQLWNVLFEEKYVDGKLTSKEEYDEELTKKLLEVVKRHDEE